MSEVGECSLPEPVEGSGGFDKLSHHGPRTSDYLAIPCQGHTAVRPYLQSSRSAGTLPPFSTSLRSTCLWSQTFIVAVSF